MVKSAVALPATFDTSAPSPNAVVGKNAKRSSIMACHGSHCTSPPSSVGRAQGPQPCGRGFEPHGGCCRHTECGTLPAGWTGPAGAPPPANLQPFPRLASTKAMAPCGSLAGRRTPPQSTWPLSPHNIWYTCLPLLRPHRAICLGQAHLVYGKTPASCQYRSASYQSHKPA